MPDVSIAPPITLDLLGENGPALSTTSDMPVIETKPDATNSKPADSPKAEDTAAATVKEAKTTEDVPADDLEQPESTSANDEPKKPAKGVQKRLDELTRQAREAERREAAALEREARLLALVESSKQARQPTVEETDRPTRDAYGDDASYIEAVAEHAANKVRRDFEAKQQAEQQAREQASIAQQTRTVQEAYVARVDKFKESHPDYSEVAESPDVSVSIPMAHAIAHSESGPEIAYYLGSNPEEAKRIAAMSPPVQLLELGKIVAKLSAAPVKPVSAAPAPIKPIKAGSETPPVDPENESMEAYAARRKKEWASSARPGMRH